MTWCDATSFSCLTWWRNKKKRSSASKDNSENHSENRRSKEGRTQASNTGGECVRLSIWFCVYRRPSRNDRLPIIDHLLTLRRNRTTAITCLLTHDDEDLRYYTAPRALRYPNPLRFRLRRADPHRPAANHQHGRLLGKPGWSLGLALRHAQRRRLGTATATDAYASAQVRVHPGEQWSPRLCLQPGASSERNGTYFYIRW